MGLTTAQAIGIGVAVGFVGALILMTILLCISRCSSTETVPSGPVLLKRTESLPQVKQPSPNPWVLTAPRDPANWRNPITNSHRTLPACVDDFTTLHEIRQGINSRYREQPLVSPSIFDEDELVRLAGEPANGGTWSKTISNVVTRGAAIRCFLAQLIFKRMHPSCPVQESLLAPEISSCYQLVINRVLGENIIGVWRECIYLLQESPWHLGHLPPWLLDENDPRKERTLAMVPAIVNSLHLESLRNDLDLKKGALEVSMGKILSKAANTAMALLGQPSEWEAVWASPEPGFIVFPEVRFTWNGKTKYSKPAEVDANVPKPVPSDNHDQLRTEPGKQHSSDVGCRSDAVAEEQQKHGADQAPLPDTFQQSGTGSTD
ncbi:hypothetical protein LCI18_013494 [Fusarium solani-melongenae]|uniref:Uncharacterized protein n=1 Tax=Fusarium solani subsp. cucurbitae TaxID=2747967 RepID=A0ACD3ZMQ8_FUSSC|nr:hypothetical protein LCI18_013494 [Fusarium solani-melongenae]